MKILLIIILILIIIGLWFFPGLTKAAITGAFSYAKDFATNVGIIK